MRTRVTKQFRLVPESHRTVHDTVIAEFTRAAEVNEVGCLYFIEQGEGDAAIKAGITQGARLSKRISEHQTGNPRKLRYVTLCLFYSRDIAREVEKELKRRFREHKVGGGQEWFDVPRKDLKKAVVKIAHDLALHQVRANANRTGFLRPELAKYFYGLLVYDITGRETFEHDESLEVENSEQANETPNTDAVVIPLVAADTPAVAEAVVCEASLDFTPSDKDQSITKQAWWRSLLQRASLL